MKSCCPLNHQPDGSKTNTVISFLVLPGRLSTKGGLVGPGSVCVVFGVEGMEVDVEGGGGEEGEDVDLGEDESSG